MTDTINAFALNVKRLCVGRIRPNTEMDTSCDRIKELRGRTSRAELSRATGVPVTTLQTLEERPQEASRYFLVLAKYWGVNLAWLQTGKGPKWISDKNLSPDAAPSQISTSGKEAAPARSKIVKIDPALLLEGFVTVANFFESAGSEFRIDIDPDLMARGYEWGQTGDSDLLGTIYADIKDRLNQREGVVSGRESGLGRRRGGGK